MQIFNFSRAEQGETDCHQVAILPLTEQRENEGKVISSDNITVSSDIVFDEPITAS